MLDAATAFSIQSTRFLLSLFISGRAGVVTPWLLSVDPFTVAATGFGGGAVFTEGVSSPRAMERCALERCTDFEEGLVGYLPE